MVDEPFQDDPSLPHENAGAAGSDSGEDSDGVPAEDELDDLLAQACSLADTVSHETGTGQDASPPPLNPAGDGTAALSPSDDEAPDHPEQVGLTNVDEQLAELDDLVAETSELLGQGEDRAGDATPQPESDATENLITPDPTESAPEIQSADSASSSEVAEPAVPAKPPATPSSSIAADSAAGIVKARTKDAATEEDGAAGVDASGGVAMGRYLRPLEPVVVLLCEAGVKLLELMDRPFARLGATARRGIGWLAIATFATAILSLIISLF